MPLTTAQKLVEAEQARHEILTGQSVSRFIDQNGESVQYNKANLSQLEEYIAELKAEIAGTPSLAYRAPMRFTFGRRPFC